MENSTNLEMCVAFVLEIGLEAVEFPGASGFLPCVEIVSGKLHFDRNCRISDFLHEAGHLAIIPHRFRYLMAGDLEDGIERMFELIEAEGIDFEDPVWNIYMNVSDQEATAWAWAAGVFLGLPGELIIGDDDYEGDGAGIRQMLEDRRYFGINGLSRAGYCSLFEGGSLPQYPKLKFWNQEDSNTL